ncbi:transglutaminase-like cysteine peptidase [Altererythrobacter arenosus]|uniref:Transglutaminase-like cysteine peptidase n=1 Tax=Altererythrobacter arenosus TaxID=3032592 RepID=A0ABY8FRV3_9SPHN|nr:transglutaminase-like cysteine peptidase [Altererythrobacter sp. CAU 1644]WFL76638.1 transglutaminase-like cysteine peptidase [Altererythrobacter sp. CAU 1644]
MFRKPLLLAAAGVALGAIPASAQASPLMVSVPTAMPLAAVGAAQVQCPVARPAASPIAPVNLGARASKASAILGGQPSALERLKLQQNAGGAPASTAGAAALAPALPAASAAVPLTAMGFTCVSREETRPVAARVAFPQVKPAAVGTGTTGGRFLGTERVRIGKTRFDAQWNRVAARGLAKSDLIAALGTVPQERTALLGEVNRWVNRAIRYESDRKDDWADAKTTLSRRAGDCEDYAILKMQLLATAGVAQDDMMLTLARDTLRRLDHAVLLVRNGEEWVMLDMQGDRVVPADMNYGYRPVMSFAGNQRYLHGQRYEAPAPKLALAN